MARELNEHSEYNSKIYYIYSLQSAPYTPTAAIIIIIIIIVTHTLEHVIFGRQSVMCAAECKLNVAHRIHVRFIQIFSSFSVLWIYFLPSETHTHTTMFGISFNSIRSNNHFDVARGVCIGNTSQFKSIPHGGYPVEEWILNILIFVCAICCVEMNRPLFRILFKKKKETKKYFVKLNNWLFVSHERNFVSFYLFSGIEFNSVFIWSDFSIPWATADSIVRHAPTFSNSLIIRH